MVLQVRGDLLLVTELRNKTAASEDYPLKSLQILLFSSELGLLRTQKPAFNFFCSLGILVGASLS